MSRSPRTPLLALTFAIVALAAVGCGGGEVSAEEVPGAPPALVVPTDSALGSGGASSSDGSTGTDNGTDSGADTGTADTTTTPEDTSGGTAAPETDSAPAPEDTTTEPEQPPAGSAPEQFESFCEQNAGAC